MNFYNVCRKCVSLMYALLKYANLSLNFRTILQSRGVLYVKQRDGHLSYMEDPKVSY